MTEAITTGWRTAHIADLNRAFRLLEAYDAEREALLEARGDFHVFCWSCGACRTSPHKDGCVTDALEQLL